MSKENLQKAREAKKPKIVFDCLEYTISKIPLNYRIDIKSYCSPKHPERGIDRDCYSDPDKGLDYAKQMAEETIDDYFVRDKGAYSTRINAKLKNKKHYGYKKSGKKRG